MKRVALGLAALLCAAGPAAAQHAPDLVRFEWVTGFIGQGSMADASFELDVSAFQGPIIRRTGGALDVDPSLWYGIRGTYRINDRLTGAVSWMHSRGRYRVQFPSLATSVDGNFDLEGLILAGEDFINANEEDVRATSAMSDALTDVFLASVTYEFPVLNRWAFPYFSLGAGMFMQKSDGDVLQIRYDTAVPTRITTVENLGFNALAASGISVFAIDELDPAVSFGGGMRVAISDRWGVDLQVEDIIRVGVDLTDIDAASTPPTDPSNPGQPYSTTFAGKEGQIHNFGVRFSVNYSLWPSGSPR